MPRITKKNQKKYTKAWAKKWIAAKKGRLLQGYKQVLAGKVGSFYGSPVDDNDIAVALLAPSSVEITWSGTERDKSRLPSTLKTSTKRKKRSNPSGKITRPDAAGPDYEIIMSESLRWYGPNAGTRYNIAIMHKEDATKGYMPNDTFTEKEVIAEAKKRGITTVRESKWGKPLRRVQVNPKRKKRVSKKPGSTRHARLMGPGKGQSRRTAHYGPRSGDRDPNRDKTVSTKTVKLSVSQQGNVIGIGSSKLRLSAMIPYATVDGATRAYKRITSVARAMAVLKRHGWSY